MAYQKKTHILDSYQQERYFSGHSMWAQGVCGTVDGPHKGISPPKNFIKLSDPKAKISDVTCKSCQRIAARWALTFSK